MQAGDCTSLKGGAKTSGSTHNPLVVGSNPTGPKDGVMVKEAP
jgi:hypothetical protein